MVGVAPAEWGRWPYASSHLISVFWSSKSDPFPVRVVLHKSCPFSLVLFIILMDRISIRELGLVASGFHLCFLQFMWSCWPPRTMTSSSRLEDFQLSVRGGGRSASPNPRPCFLAGKGCIAHSGSGESGFPWSKISSSSGSC